MEAEVSSAARLRQIREAFPEVWCSSRTALSRPDPGAPDLARWLPGRPLPDDLTTVEGLLPITVSVLDQPAGRAEAGFAAPAGADMAEVCWSALSWPGVSTTR